ncbi:class I SAM-dependent methyltransferase [Streptomyces sp. H10-C2]|uniref:class I SAM-dependent methyltransferase n=1 Tax=unclassified Streptomyces TaxID=2593676 RepID=UPI0024B8F0B4|nr:MULTISPECIES: class I SAM-dependent methyltransferase [unclassified Streptomyces]MDJ0347198.1 class I SAM-dependent methyltransferase [Streptomyces sp. PH10-H1]MDJ0370329.1 class I SAM-dependent methyltransferase [Streptomyces sp. H10-C2]
MSADAAADPLRRATVSQLLRALARQGSDHTVFHRLRARYCVQQVAKCCELGGRTVVDVGGGDGWCAEAFRAAGARCVVVDPFPVHARTGPATVVGDGYWLPLLEGAADVCYCSDVLGRIPDPVGLVDELIRVTRPDGTVCLAFTNWRSPGGRTRFPVRTGTLLRHLRGRPDVVLVEAGPRYFPRVCRGLLRVPVLRGFAVQVTLRRSP